MVVEILSTLVEITVKYFVFCTFANVLCKVTFTAVFT
jgi:hypothetical protein